MFYFSKKIMKNFLMPLVLFLINKNNYFCMATAHKSYIQKKQPTTTTNYLCFLWYFEGPSIIWNNTKNI